MGCRRGHRPVIVRYRAIPFRCPSDSRAIIGRYHTIVRGLAGISPGSMRVQRGIRQEPGRYPAETYARCMTMLVKKSKKNHRNVKYVYNFDELRALETRQTPTGLLLYIRGRWKDAGQSSSDARPGIRRYRKCRPGSGRGPSGTRPDTHRYWAGGRTMGPVDKSTKKSPMAGRYEGLSDRHRPICVGFDSDELPITKSSEEYNSALNSSDAPTEVCFTLRCRPSICGSPYDFPIF